MLRAWYLLLVYVGWGSWFVTGRPGGEKRNIASPEEEEEKKEEEEEG